MRISTHYSKHVKTALAHRANILRRSIFDDSTVVKEKELHPFGENVKMVRRRTKKHTQLTSDEKYGVVRKYEGGMSMAAIADEYGCHYTTIGRILRKMNVDIRDTP